MSSHLPSDQYYIWFVLSQYIDSHFCNEFEVTGLFGHMAIYNWLTTYSINKNVFMVMRLSIIFMADKLQYVSYILLCFAKMVHLNNA